LKDIGGQALANAAGADCTKCIDLLMARNLDAMQHTIALSQVMVLDNPNLVRQILQHAANVNAPRSDRPDAADVRRRVRLAPGGANQNAD
jgi:hypothetical protein